MFQDALQGHFGVSFQSLLFHEIIASAIALLALVSRLAALGSVAQLLVFE